jgi:uncharacterized protein with PIN domain/sulfur carrier protein ThiS
MTLRPASESPIVTVASLRFYEELNDFLAPPRRKRTFAYRCGRGATVKHVIEALGVPHTEVELILANGDPVDFSYVVREGDRISVYPVFEALDVTPVLKLRGEPLRRTRFVVDAHLGGLARYLRMLGFDTLYENGYADDELVRISAAERRILLTRDRALLMRRSVSHGCYVRSTRPRQQLEEIVARLDLYRAFAPFSRCLRCNRELEPVAKEAIRDRLPARSDEFYRRFWICGACDRIYWEGSHWRRMRELVGGLGGQEGAARGGRSGARGSRGNARAGRPSCAD